MPLNGTVWSRPIRVGVAAPSFPPAIGGAESFVEMFSLTLARRDDVVVHIATAVTPEERVLEAIGIRGGTWDALASSLDGTSLVWEQEAFERARLLHAFCHRHEIDIIHAFSHDSMLAAAMATAPGGGLEHIRIVASPSEMATDDTPFGRARSRFVYSQRVDGLFQTSRYYLGVARRYGCQPKAERIAAAVDVELFDHGDRQRGRVLLGVGHDEPLVVCPSRFSERKGQLDLIAAFPHLDTSRRPTVVFTGSTHSGSEDFLARVRTAAAETQVTTRFVLDVPRQTMPDVLAAADLVVQPSRREGLGTAALEAMVAGAPVILTRVSGFDEIAEHGRTAWFVPSQDPPALAAAIETLLSDPHRRAELARQARCHVTSRYCPDDLGSAAVDLYRTLMGTDTDER